jgi:hypothetical protein
MLGMAASYGESIRKRFLFSFRSFFIVGGFLSDWQALRLGADIPIPLQNPKLNPWF